MRGLLFSLGVVLIPYGASRLLSPWRMVTRHALPEPSTPRPDSVPSLRLASYNIAHGRGDGHYARNWTGESRAQRLHRLDEIAQLLRTADADVVVLNEVDFDSSWSRGINQARELAERAGYRYWVEERNLDFRVLFWKWRFGNAVLSKHPIKNPRVIDLPAYSRLESLLVGKKRGVVCDVEVGGRTVRIAGVHLCHRSEKVRAESAALLAAMAAESAHPFFVVGDLNSTPPEFKEGNGSTETVNAIRVLDTCERFQRRPVSKPVLTEMTFHSATPRAVIDWILIPRDWEFRNYAVLPSNLSDHRLVSTEVSPEWEPHTDSIPAPQAIGSLSVDGGRADPG